MHALCVFLLFYFLCQMKLLKHIFLTGLVSFLWRKDKILYTQEKPSKWYLMYADNEIM